MNPLKTPLKKQTGHLTSLAVSALFGLTLSACAFSENPGAGTPPPVKTGDVLDTLQTEKDKEASDGVLTSANVSVTFEENPTPGSYQMIIQWPTNIRHVTINVNAGLPLIVRNSDRASIAVASGKPHNIQIVAYGAVSSSPLSSLELSVDSPVDRIFDKQMSLAEATTFTANRVFFKPGAQILTNRHPLVIETQKLYATTDEGNQSGSLPFATTAHIATGIIGTLAKNDSDLQGGVVTISAKEAHGHLTIAMIGVDGRDGDSGEVVEAAMSPRPSRVARVDPSLNGAAGIEEQVGRRCKPGVAMDTSGCGPSMSCTKPPSNGRDGAQGDPGIAGAPADNAGSFGKLTVSIEDSTQLVVEVGSMYGNPGKGKNGSPGFPGVVGGRAGDAPGSCSAVAAKNGSDGPPGKQGATGKDGGLLNDGVLDGGRTPFRPAKITR